ncbi:thioredoxin [Murinocardiopsis flavida]|uniref:Thioredoxin n=1 Tax=Murinocardiopsis flavida TaxID=645275 RepID=A0A2P8DQH7_9ACTN|nr:thioredoxin [Murinocardiopsis flavida]PSK99468.1 thioredoxin [Murinocardiopsis flavida]
MATIELTKDNFNETVTENDLVLIDFWASWCGPCRMFGPVYEKAAEKNPDLVFGKVDTEAQQELAAGFDIQSIPTLMVVREKTVIFSQPGALPEESLNDLIKQARELDMEAVRAEIEKQQADGAAKDGESADA